MEGSENSCPWAAGAWDNRCAMKSSRSEGLPKQARATEGKREGCKRELSQSLMLIF